jgi:hypothetical protein
MISMQPGFDRNAWPLRSHYKKQTRLTTALAAIAFGILYVPMWLLMLALFGWRKRS